MIPPPADDRADPLVRRYREFVDDVASVLDLDVGAAEASQARHYARLTADLRDTLELDAGVSAVLGASGPPRPAVSSPPAAAVPPPRSWANRLSGRLRELDPPTRLELRSDRVGGAFGDLLDLLHAVGHARDVVAAVGRHPDLVSARAVTDELHRTLAGDLAVDGGELTRARNLAPDRALDLVLDLARHLDGARLHAQLLERALARGRGARRANLPKVVRDLTHVLEHAATAVHALVNEALVSIDRVLGGDLRSSGEVHVVPSSESRALRHVVSQVLDDFIGADLRSASLGGAALDGLRWSDSTLWPSGWAEQIKAASAEIGPGVFQVTGWRRGRDRHELGI